MALPLFRRHLLQRLAHLAQHAAGVVHQDVNVAGGRCRLRFSDEREDRVPIAHVYDTSLAPAACVRAELLGLE